MRAEMLPLDGIARFGVTLPARSEVTRATRWRMKLSKAVELFLQEVRVSKAKATAAAYESDLNRLIALAGMNSVLAFTADVVRLYFTTESQRGNSMATLHRKMAALSELGKWGVRHQLWAANPVATMPRIRKPQHLPRPFSATEVERLLALPLGPQDRVLRALLFFTGLRVSPICGLKVGDLSFVPPTIRATVKGARVQVIEMHDVLRELLYNWTLEHTDLAPQSPLLRQATGKPLTRRMVERTTHEWGEAVKVPACLPHRFRHTFATGLLQAGVDIRVIKDALGHADLRSTQLYTEVTPGMVRAGIQKLSWPGGAGATT